MNRLRSLGVPRRAIVTALLALGASHAACSRPAGPARTAIAVVPKGQVHVFWQTVRAGAEAASKEAGVEMLWAAPQVETDFTGQASTPAPISSRPRRTGPSTPW